MLDLVEDFHEFMGLYPFEPPYEGGKRISKKVAIEKRKALIREEAEELCEALDEGDIEHILAESNDLIYVALGALVEQEIPQHVFKAGFLEVQRANMQKVPPSNQKDKPSKPEGWEKPNMKKALASEGEQTTWLLTFTDGKQVRNTAIQTRGCEMRKTELERVIAHIKVTQNLEVMPTIINWQRLEVI